MTKHRAAKSARPARRGAAFLAASAACWLALGHGAQAIETCAGTWSASSLSPVPSPNVVQYQPMSNDQPTALGDRFIAGLQRAGVVMTGQPTTQLSINATMTPPSGSSLAAGMLSPNWFQDPSAPVVSSTLRVGLTLAGIQTPQILWIANVTCVVQTSDTARMAETIGERLGHAIGKNFDPTPF